MELDRYLDEIIESTPDSWVGLSPPLYLASLSSVSSHIEGREHKWVEAASPLMLYTYRPNIMIQIAYGLRDDDR